MAGLNRQDEDILRDQFDDIRAKVTSGLLTEAQEDQLRDKADLIVNTIKTGTSPTPDTSPLPTEHIPREVFSEQAMRGPNVPVNDQALQQGIEQRTAAAQAGVVQGQPLPEGVSAFGMGFADDPVKGLKAAFAEAGFGNIPVRLGPETGKLEYLDPKSNRYTQLEKGAAGVAGSIVGEGLPLGLGLAGGVTGAVLAAPAGMSIPGVVAGEAIGEGLGEFATLWFGREFLGQNKGMTNQQLREAAYTRGANAAPYALGGSLVGQAGKSLQNVSKGRVITEKGQEAVDLMSDVNSRQVADQIPGFKPDVARLSNDPILLQARDALARDPRFIRQFNELDRENQQALLDYMADLEAPFRTGAQETTLDVGHRIQDEVTESLDFIRGSAERRVSDELAESTKLSNSIFVRDEDALGSIFQERIARRQAALNRLGDRMNNKIRAKAGFDPVTRDSNVKFATPDTVNLMDGLTREARMGISQLTTNVKSALLKGDLGKQVATPGGTIPAIDLMAVQNEIQTLGKIVRSAKVIGGVVPPAVADIKRLIGALKSDRNAALLRQGRTDLLNDIKNMESTLAKGSQALRKGLVGDLTVVSDGRFTKSGRQVFNAVIKRGNERGATEVANTLSKSPRILQDWRNGILDKYRQEVFRNGKPKKDLHDKFMRDFGSTIEPFMNKASNAKMRQFGQFSTTIEHLEQQLKFTEQSIKRSFPGQIERTDVDSVTKLFLKFGEDGSVGQIRRLKKLVSHSPELMDSVRTLYLQKMRGRMMSKGVLVVSRMDTFLSNQSGNVKELFGDKFLKDMGVLRDAVEIEARRQAVGGPQKQKSALNDIARAYVGLFTRPGRMITAYGKIRAKSSEEAFANALMSPESLSQLVKLRKMKPGSRAAIAVMSSFGSGEFWEEAPAPSVTDRILMDENVAGAL